MKSITAARRGQEHSALAPARVAVADPDGVLDDIADVRRRELILTARKLGCAADWADANPDLNDRPMVLVDRDGSYLDDAVLHGDGRPAVARECVAEFAVAAGLSEAGTVQLISEALELRHRLPRCWQLVFDLELPAWRARQIASLTYPLPARVADFVDRQVASVRHGRIGPIQVEHLVDAAVAQFAPELARTTKDPRRVDIDRRPSLNGYATIDGVLDFVDAHDLDHALTERAGQLAGQGVDADLNVRRAVALGDLARQQPVLDLSNHAPADADNNEAAQARIGETTVCANKVAARPRPTSPVLARRLAVLYLHLSDQALTDHVNVRRHGNTNSPVLADTIRRWLHRDDVKLIIKPVIDLDDSLHAEQYEIPDRIRERVVLRDPTCAFPGCHRVALPGSARPPGPDNPDDPGGGNHHSLDIDHITPYERGGPTSTDNLAPLCRHHHRLKTFHGWRYTMSEPGVYVWTSPHGRLSREESSVLGLPRRGKPVAERSEEHGTNLSGHELLG